MCFGEANIWYKEKTTTNVIRTGAIATKNSLALEYRTMLEVVVEEERESIYVPGYILSMVLHIRESAMDLKEVQYLLFNGYE